jgi:hypothetical protein
MTRSWPLRRALVFMGGSRAIASAFQRTVTGNLKALATAGVLVPKAGRRPNKPNAVSHHRLAAPADPSWQALQSEVRDATSDTMLLMVPGLLRAGGVTARHAAVVDQLSAIADEVVVASVVADQLTLINEHYLHLVATWRTSARLENLAWKLSSHDMFVHEQLLRPWYREPAVRYLAITLSDYHSGNPLQVVLEAAGMVVPELGESVPPLPALGPTGVEANRLLTTYLRALAPDFKPDSPQVAAISRTALTRAEGMGWCTPPFWGWTAETAERAVARFAASNERFAHEVWDADWPLAAPVEQPNTQVDFLDLDFQVVDQIQHYVLTTATRVAVRLEGAE